MKALMTHLLSRGTIAAALAMMGAMGTSLGACTQSYPSPSEASRPANVAKAIGIPQPDILRSWQDALVFTLESAERERWSDVSEATSWEWPAFADYRLYYLGRAEEFQANVTAAAKLYGRVVLDSPDSVHAADAQERLLLMRLALGQDAKLVAETEAWARAAGSAAERNRRTLVLGQVYEAAERPADAARVYRRLQIDWPASESAAIAGRRLVALAKLKVLPEPLTRAEQRQRADGFYSARAYDAAADLYAKLQGEVKTSAERQELLVQRGLARFLRRKYPDAEQLFDQARKLNPGSPDYFKAQYYYAFTLSRLGRPERSMSEYRALIKDGAGKAHAEEWAALSQYKIGLIYLQENDNPRAEKEFAQYLRAYPKGRQRDDVLWGLAWAQYNQNRFAEARKSFQQRSLTGDDTALSASYWVARCDEQLGKTQAAQDGFRKLAQSHPLDYYGFLAAARIPETVDAFPVRRTFAQEPVTAATRPETAHFHLERGEALVQMNRPVEAEREYLAAAQVSKGRDLHLAVAQALASVGRYRAAQQMIWASFRSELLRKDVFYTDLWELAYPKAFHALVHGAATQRQTDPFIVLALMREESRYQPDVSSPADAFGLLQIIVPTAKRVAARLGLPEPSRNDLYGPELNITLGTAYIRSLIDIYQGNLFLAFAGYNGGPQNVNRWMARRPDAALDEFVEQIPFTETRNYVRKVTTSLLRYQFIYMPDEMLAGNFLTAAMRKGPGADDLE
jgi:soluble lytic murein transglycosylase